MNNWQIGDRAIFVGSGSRDEANLGGQIVELLEYRECAYFTGNAHIDNAWRIDNLSPPAWVAESYLRPIPDEYDGKQVVTWDECPFKPRELVMA